MTSHFAKDVVIDYRAGQISIDGVPFDYYVSPDIDIDHGREEVVTVGIKLYADAVHVIGFNGERRTVASDLSHETDSEWARRTARRIVLEGMADVLEWLDEARKQYIEATEEAREHSDELARMQRWYAARQRPRG